ncbi:MAG: hypothetical protein KIT60_12165 [Burkholderiaceae bacterium]|nr:hypothetical protein [Burkholderiaceae bacterium]
MSIFSLRLRALAEWLAEANHVWLALAVPLLALGICLRPGMSEPFIRLTGLALQILGIGTVVWGILATRAFFGRPSPIAQVRGWLKRCPLFGGTISASAGTAVSRSFAGRLHGYSSVPIDPKAPVDTRIEVVERNIGLIHERITATIRVFDSDLGELRNHIAEETSKRESTSDHLRARIEEASTGGIHISAIGAAWLFVGVVLSTSAPEIAVLIK